MAVFYWSRPESTCVTVTLVDSRGRVSTVTTTSVSQYFARFKCQNGDQNYLPSGLVSGPAYAISNDRVYWWDGHLIRWLGRDGTQGSEELDPGAQVGLGFAVSPDDLHAVITTVDFGRWPLHRVTWVEDVVTHANQAVLFEADLPTDLDKLNGQGSAGWPWGWNQGRPVLYDHPLCVGLGGDQFIALDYPRVVDPKTGSRLVTFPKCYGGSITAGGAFCTASFTARALDWYDWTGKQIQSYALPYDTVFCDSDLNPSGTRVLAYCQNNIYTGSLPQSTKTLQWLFGAGPSLPIEMQQPGLLRWVDDDLVIEPRAITPGYSSSVYIWSLSRQTSVAGPISIPGWYSVGCACSTRLR